jgi:hypothetical protein
MTCYRKATACTTTVRKGYSTAGQCSPFACQQELALQRQHDPLYACQRQQTQDGTRPYPDGGYAQRLMRKISGSEALKAPMCTLFNMSPGPPVGTPLSVHAPLRPIKRRARTLQHKFHELTSSHKLPPRGHKSQA